MDVLIILAILIAILIAIPFWKYGGDDGEPWDHDALSRAVNGDEGSEHRWE